MSPKNSCESLTGLFRSAFSIGWMTESRDAKIHAILVNQSKGTMPVYGATVLATIAFFATFRIRRSLFWF
jgi:hypothetical protein